jgi:hypothetical protein
VFIDPKDALGWKRLGFECSELGDWSRARQAFDQSLTFSADDAEALVGLAMALLAQQDLPQLEKVSRDLVNRYPNLAHSHLVSGHLNKILGNRVRAVESYRTALELSPMMTDAMFNLCDLEPPSLTDPLFIRMEQISRTEINTRDRVNICFALARTLESAGIYAHAFEYFAAGNRAVRAMMRDRGIVYDQSAGSRSVERICTWYTPGALSRPLKRLPLDIRMIFIVGLPRSGTSLVEQILASHSEVAGGGESPLMQRCLREYERRRCEFSASEPIDTNDAREVALLEATRERYLEGIFARDLDKKFVTDKLPGNFFALGLIRLLFPDALIVHCRREPIAVCWSLYTAHFGTHEPYYNSFEDLAHYHALYCGVMKHWRAVLSPPMIEICYEDLVSAGDEGIRRFVADCGLTWEDACLNFYELSRPVYTASQLQVRRPIYQGALSRWRNYERQIEPLIDLLGRPADR